MISYSVRPNDPVLIGGSGDGTDECDGGGDIDIAIGCETLPNVP